MLLQEGSEINYLGAPTLLLLLVKRPRLHCSASCLPPPQAPLGLGPRGHLQWRVSTPSPSLADEIGCSILMVASSGAQGLASSEQHFPHALGAGFWMSGCQLGFANKKYSNKIRKVEVRRRLPSHTY